MKNNHLLFALCVFASAAWGDVQAIDSDIEIVRAPTPDVAVSQAVKAAPVKMRIVLRQGTLKGAAAPAKARYRAAPAAAAVKMPAPKPLSVVQARKQTLRKELASEKAALSRTKSQLARADGSSRKAGLLQAVSDREANIKALQRELMQL